MWIWRKQNSNTFSFTRHISIFQNWVFWKKDCKTQNNTLLGFKRHFDPSWHTLWLGNNWIRTYRSLFWLKFTFANSAFALKLNFYHISELLSFFIHCRFLIFRLVLFFPRLPSLLRDTWQLYIHSLFTGDTSISVRKNDQNFR